MSYPNPMPFMAREHQLTSGRRVLRFQRGVTHDELAGGVKQRAYLMGDLAYRAVESFTRAGDVDWDTMRFEMTRVGNEPPVIAELWVWKVWAG